MSATTCSESVIREVEDKLTWYTKPIFEKLDIECIVFALRSHDNPLQWLRYRARLFENPDIVTYTESVLDGIKQKEKTA